ncbi:hypothetical protein ACHQM5_013301 [Ranunculus cassubicifolius]
MNFMVLFMVYCLMGVHLVTSQTYPTDVATLQSILEQWKNLPPSWGKNGDPCGSRWEGVNCTGSRVTELRLSTMNLVGTLGGDIGELSELKSLDLSFNKGLTGSVSPRIGDLKNLNILILAGCRFSGSIPEELGSLTELSYLALNSNKFSGNIPSTLGNLSKLYWLDLADNQIEGSIPISTDRTYGLDQLLHAKHFHLNKNSLVGGLSAKLFSSRMELIHLLVDGNNLSGEIPETLGLVTSLEVLRMDGNSLSGTVPSNLNDLSLYELHLANNKLTGPVPDLTGMKSLSYVDLSNNSFDPSEAPSWFSTLNSLTTLIMENVNLRGPVPQKLFSFPLLQQVKLKNNRLNGSLNIGNEVSNQLRLVDFEGNKISSAELQLGYGQDIILVGNPLCEEGLSYTNYCQFQQPSNASYFTIPRDCGPKPCLSNQMLNPQNCRCAIPYEGTLYFRAPFFRDLSNTNIFNDLERDLWVKLGLTAGSVSLQNPFFNTDNYLQIQLYLFPPTGKYFDRTEIQTLGFSLSNQTYKPPKIFGPYYFLAFPYDFQDKKGGTSESLGMTIGIAIGGILLVIILILVAVYAVRQKKRADTTENSKSFASWPSTGKDSESAPQLKGARWFSYDELKKSTNNFQDKNEVGTGGYGKVYRGLLSNGKVVAVKRAKQGSMQGGHEFKTEIELLSRVHHKNLVSLIGFCFEQGEQMLVYEFIVNGTLRDSLSGKSGIHLDWKKRLLITLGSARGLTYLHKHANPPIIHRDIKSSNILLDETLTAKVADFGLSKLMQDAEKGHVSTQVKGTMGYLDPEYYMTEQLTEKSDVYSFGVVMLELVTAKHPIERGVHIGKEVRTKLDKNDNQHCGLKELLDPSIQNERNLIGFGRYVELAMQCLAESGESRPSMSTMVKEIEAILQSDGYSNSASTSNTEIYGKSAHPYDHILPRKQATDVDYSGDFAPSAKVEPKHHQFQCGLDFCSL